MRTHSRLLAAAVLLLFAQASPATAQDKTGQPELLPPRQLGDGWSTGSLTDVGMAGDSILQLLEKIRAKTYRDVHSVLIARGGRLVFEAYFPGYAYDYEGEAFHGPWTEFGPETLHNTASVTKSITGLLVGIAVDQGCIPGPDASVFSFFAEYAHLSDEAKDKITLAHLLTMTSGLEWNEQDVSYSQLENDIIQLFLVEDPAAYVLAKPLVHAPASTWYYNGGGPNLLGEIIQRCSGKRLDQFAEEHLFSHLGITDAEWVFINSDFVYASGDMKLRSRDLAKLGQLVLDGGTWNGREIVSPAWVEAMTRARVSLGPAQAYAFLWWTRVYSVGADSVNAVMADGWGGQRIMLFPDYDLVVVFTGGNYTEQHRLDEAVSRYVLPALSEVVKGN
jgi:CubicO group peptidase (beta-lactamase class C family)